MEKVKNIFKTLTDLLIKQFITFVASNGLFLMWIGISHIILLSYYDNSWVAKRIGEHYDPIIYTFIPAITYIVFFSRNKTSIQPVISSVMFMYYFISIDFFVLSHSTIEELLLTAIKGILVIVIHFLILYLCQKINFLQLNQKISDFKNSPRIKKFTSNLRVIFFNFFIFTVIGLLLLVIGLFFYLVVVYIKAYWSLIIIFIFILSKKKISFQNFLLAFMLIGLVFIVYTPENKLLYPYVTPFICTFITLTTYYYLNQAMTLNNTEGL